MAKSIRKGISKKVRFEVFKRDKFTCQYCGLSAPDVILNIDHIKPVAGKGGNEILNLITACFDCNNGKRDKSLSDNSEIVKQKKQLDLLQERREQLNMMLEWRDGLDDLEEQKIEAVISLWYKLAPGYEFSDEGRRSVSKLIKKFPIDELFNGMNIAATQYLKWDGPNVTSDSWGLAFNKIAAICSLEKASKDNPDLKEFYYLRGILRNRISYHDPQLTIEWLEAARSWGVPLQVLRNTVLRVKSWTAFSNAITDVIESYKNPF